MRARWFATLLMAVAALTATVGIGVVQANHLPAGAVDCQITAFVVTDPAPLSAVTQGTGVLGAARILGVNVRSQVECTGSITGTGDLDGSFAWCPNTHGTGAFPCRGKTGQSTGPDEALWPGALPTSVHIVGNASVVPNGLVPFQDTVTGQSVGSCSMAFQGHATAPVRMHVTLTCGTHSFHGQAPVTFVPLLSVAGNNFQPASGGSFAECPAPPSGPPDCLRALVIQGDIHATSVDVIP